MILSRRVFLCIFSLLYFNYVTALLETAVPVAGMLKRRGADDCKPLVIAHRGASGYVPEHTLGAYALSVTMGSDYVEPDLVMTRDGHLIARHENDLGVSTNVAKHPEFGDRRRKQMVNNRLVFGWFSEDFTLAEIKTLKSKESMPIVRIGNTRMDGAFEVPTFQEIIDLVKAMEKSENRTIGIYPELKYGSHFQQLGLAMEQPVVDMLHKNGYVGPDAPAYIQSFEVNNLKELKTITDLRLVQLYGRKSNVPYDQGLLGANLTYGQMATKNGLAEVVTYATGVGPPKNYIIPRTAANRLGKPTSFVEDAHNVGLEVHPYTFRAENIYLPQEFHRVSINGVGDLEGEVNAFIAAGVDGLFIDQPDVLIRVRNCE